MSALLGGGALSGCVPPARELPLVLVQGVAPLGLDPHLNGDFSTFGALSNVYDGLTFLDGDLKVQPALAESWESPDELTWRFHLRPGVVFHDRRPVTAEDVVWSLKRAREHPKSDVAGYLHAVGRVRALDPRTVEIETSRHYPTLLNRLAFVLVVPARSSGSIESAVGTGPYRIAAFQPGALLELEAFDGYWGARPVEPRAVLEFVTSTTQRRERLARGGVALASQLAPKEVAALSEAAGCRLLTGASMAVTYIQLQTQKPPFSDPRVREALDVALDRDRVVAADVAGHGRPAGQIVSRSVFGFNPEIQPASRDLARAAALLRAAGHASGLDVELTFHDGKDPAELLRQLSEAGFRIEPKAMPWDDLYARLRARTVELYLGTAIADSGDAGDILDTKIHTPDPPAGYGGSNYVGYSDPTLDALIEESNSAENPEKRGRLLQSAVKRVSEERPLVPLYVPDDLYCLGEGIEWKPRRDGRVLVREISRAR